MDAFRLVRLAHHQHTAFPPGDHITVTHDDICRVVPHTERLVYVNGEREGGQRGFMEWVRSAPIRVVEIRNPVEDGDVERVLLGTEPGTASTVVVIHDLERPSTDRDAIASRIARAVDRAVVSPSIRRVIVFGSAGRLQNGPNSLANDTVWRLPQLSIGDIMSRPAIARLQDPDPAARRVLAWTGGQPLLVDLLLNRTPASASPDDIDAAGTELRIQTPTALKWWKAQLQETLSSTEGRTAIRTALDFCRGDRVGPDQLRGDAFLRLYAGGWIGPSRLKDSEAPGKERWGMSLLHQTWARDVIRSIQSGMRPTR